MSRFAMTASALTTRTLSPVLLLLFISGLGVSMTGCEASEGRSGECVPGESNACRCDDGQPGATVCGDTGHFSACQLDGATCAADSTPPSDVGSGADDLTTAGNDTAPASDDTGGTAADDTGSTADDTGSTTDETGSTADDTGSTADDLGVDHGAGPSVTCPFPAAVGLGKVSEAFGDQAEHVNMAFFNDGGLATLDDVACSVAAHTPDTADDVQRFPERCYDSYLCGACPIVIRNNPSSGAWSFWLETSDPGTVDTCPQIAAFYDVCVPGCGARVCGDDACGLPCGICELGDCDDEIGQCVPDPCRVCIHNCLQFPVETRPNCCQCGDGCFCGSECASHC